MLRTKVHGLKLELRLAMYSIMHKSVSQRTVFRTQFTRMQVLSAPTSRNVEIEHRSIMWSRTSRECYFWLLILER